MYTVNARYWCFVNNNNIQTVNKLYLIIYIIYYIQ